MPNPWEFPDTSPHHNITKSPILQTLQNQDCVFSSQILSKSFCNSKNLEEYEDADKAVMDLLTWRDILDDLVHYVHSTNIKFTLNVQSQNILRNHSIF